MNEINLLEIYYNEMKALGASRLNVFLSVDADMLAIAQQFFDKNVQIEDLQRLADICIANEWLERTTADPYYNFLSLTEAGLQIVLSHQYSV